jgi:hypothetical protein
MEALTSAWPSELARKSETCRRRSLGALPHGRVEPTTPHGSTARAGAVTNTISRLNPTRKGSDPSHFRDIPGPPVFAPRRARFHDALRTPPIPMRNRQLETVELVARFQNDALPKAAIITRPPPDGHYGRKTMEWFSRKTSIAGVQIPNWILVVAAVVVIWIIYTFTR